MDTKQTLQYIMAIYSDDIHTGQLLRSTGREYGKQNKLVNYFEKHCQIINEGSIELEYY